MANLPRLETIEQSVAISGFTDDGQRSGHLDLTAKIPAGSFVVGWKGTITTRFTGGVSEQTLLSVGTPADPGRFGSRRVEGVGREIGLAPGDNARYAPVESAIRLTVEDLMDFGNIVGGALDFSLVYVRTVA
jgi:hypothetical protein